MNHLHQLGRLVPLTRDASGKANALHVDDKLGDTRVARELTRAGQVELIRLDDLNVGAVPDVVCRPGHEEGGRVELGHVAAQPHEEVELLLVKDDVNGAELTKNNFEQRVLKEPARLKLGVPVEDRLGDRERRRTKRELLRGVLQVLETPSFDRPGPAGGATACGVVDGGPNGPRATNGDDSNWPWWTGGDGRWTGRRWRRRRHDDVCCVGDARVDAA